jgi:dTDP-4-dehydrorhamnose reductase
MKALVVGASGFLGAAVFDRLRERGAEVLGTQCSATRPGLVRFDLAKDSIADCVPASFLAKSGPAHAVVCTTARSMDDCASQERTDHVHIVQTLRLLKDLAAMGFRVLFISTGYVFDGNAGYYVESDEPHPLGDYGRQKLAVERALATEAPAALVFRLEKLISSEMSPRNLFSQWLEMIHQGKPIECIAGQIFAPTATWDVADATFTAFERGLTGLYHVCNTEYFLREELAFQFCRTLGVKARIISKPMEAFCFADPRPLKTYLDSTKFRRATGFSFTTVREVMEGFRRNCLKSIHAPART